MLVSGLIVMRYFTVARDIILALARWSLNGMVKAYPI